MNLLVAFAAGLLTFLSPCVLPLIPSYISYISGFSVEELSSGNREKVLKKAVYGSLYFIAGFTVIFVFLGMTASLAGSLIYGFQNYLRVIGGAVIIILGLQIIGVINFGFLDVEKRMRMNTGTSGNLGSIILGMTFAAGWVPCVGPILSSILIIASVSGSRLYGGSLLFSYCMGLGLPILASAVAFNYFLAIYAKMKVYLRALSIISGVFLILIGVLLIADNVTLITNYLVFLFSRKPVN